jgi:tripeptide aminopeptidase
MDAAWSTRARAEAEALRGELLAHLALLGECPAPSGAEQDRITLWLERLAELPGVHCHQDEFGNGVAIWPGETDGPARVMVTHADGVLPEDEEPEIAIRPDSVTGPFAGDNSPALAALATLPTLLDRLGARGRGPLVLLAAARMLDRHNFEGLVRHLETTPRPEAVIAVETVELGRLNYTALGLRRCRLTVEVPESYDWMRFGATGALLPMTELIQRICGIPLPRAPLTSIVLGKIRGGVSARQIAREVRLGFEVRSESSELLQSVEAQIRMLCAEVASLHGVRADLDVYARREPGRLDIAHPLVRGALDALDRLNIPPMIYPSTGMLTAALAHGAPAITVGLARSHRAPGLEEIEESLDIPSLCNGLTQLAWLAVMPLIPPPEQKGSRHG